MRDGILEACETFFPKEWEFLEQLANSEANGGWLLFTEKFMGSGYYNFYRKWEEHKESQNAGKSIPLSKHAAIQIRSDPEWRLSRYARCLCILALYSPASFRVSASAVAEPGWRIIPFQNNPVSPGTLSGTSYVVSKQEWDGFIQFIRLCEGAFHRLEIGKGDVSSPFERALLYYVVAGFGVNRMIPGETAEESTVDLEYPDIFYDPSGNSIRSAVRLESMLYYVISMEALASEREDFQNGRATDKSAWRVASLAANSSGERSKIRDFIKDTYDCRSRFVHGNTIEIADLTILRRICQRAFAVTVMLSEEIETQQNLLNAIRQIPHNQRIQELAKNARHRLGRLAPDFVKPMFASE